MPVEQAAGVFAHTDHKEGLMEGRIRGQEEERKTFENTCQLILARLLYIDI